MGDRKILDSITSSKIVGRQPQLSAFREALNAFQRDGSRLVLLSGPAGIGKTRFLDAVRNAVSGNRLTILWASARRTAVNCPYGLAAQLMSRYLAAQPSTGTNSTDPMNMAESRYIHEALGRLAGTDRTFSADDGRNLREAVYRATLRFFCLTAESTPLLLFIDDVHFADEATRHLLGRLMTVEPSKIFVTATCGDDRPVAHLFPGMTARRGRPKPPWVHSQLTPLKSTDIAQYIGNVWPNARLHSDDVDTLERESQGNPAVLSTWIRSRVLKGGIPNGLSHVRRAPGVSLPTAGGFERFVLEQLSALGPEFRRVMETAAVAGQSVSVNLLTGITGLTEYRVLHIIELAKERGLLDAADPYDKNCVRFMGRRVRDVVCRAVGLEGLRKRHREVALYLECQASNDHCAASHLLFHFKCAKDKERTNTYAERLSGLTHRMFNLEDAGRYAPTSYDPRSVGRVLPETAAKDVIRMINCWILCLRNRRLYRSGSSEVLIAQREFTDAMADLFSATEVVRLTRTGDALSVNGGFFAADDFRKASLSMIQLFKRFHFTEVVFYRGLTDGETDRVITHMASCPESSDSRYYWMRFVMMYGFAHVRFLPANDAMVPRKIAEKRLESSVATVAQDILRQLILCVDSARRHTISSKAANRAMQSLAQSLRRLLAKEPMLKISIDDEAIYINGLLLQMPSETETRKRFTDLMARSGLFSITFHRHFAEHELKRFLAAVINRPRGLQDDRYWEAHSLRHPMTGVRFNR